MKAPPPITAPPKDAWSATGRAFHPQSHFCTHCRVEIAPGGKMWYKTDLVLCPDCLKVLFPASQWRN